ncbi:MAG: hypothetical protein U1E22_06750 [Coriobacteriia bacterium]|nr:hypothetical protein [Coriobacteriia bacterium]
MRQGKIRAQLSPTLSGRRPPTRRSLHLLGADGGPLDEASGVETAGTRLQRVYIDGYNFYYGALKGTGFKWLDPVARADALLPSLEIEVVKYFRARIAGNPWNGAERAW